MIFAFPHTLTGLEDAVADVESWRWVQENTPALNGDRVAKRELAVRLEHAQRHLEDIAGRVFGLRGYRFEPGAAAWVQSGQVHAPSDARTFLAWLSALCHMTYRAAPPLHNELLNRDSRNMPPHINRLAS